MRRSPSRPAPTTSATCSTARCGSREHARSGSAATPPPRSARDDDGAGHAARRTHHDSLSPCRNVSSAALSSSVVTISLRRRTLRTGAGRWTARQWAALVCVLAGYVVGTLTTSGTAIALPTIATELHASPAGMQWFMTGYLLAATCLVLVAGALGDRFGRRLVLRISSVLYTLGMAAAAVAPSIGVLDAARVLAGVGSAGLMACGAAVLASS